MKQRVPYQGSLAKLKQGYTLQQHSRGRLSEPLASLDKVTVNGFCRFIKSKLKISFVVRFVIYRRNRKSWSLAFAKHNVAFLEETDSKIVSNNGNLVKVNSGAIVSKE